MTTDFNLLRNVRSQVGHALDQRDKLLDTSVQLAAQAAAADADATAAIAAGNARAAKAAQTRADAARQKRASAVTKLTELDTHVRDQLGRLQAIDPCDAEADVPIALFPVRLETRYTDDGAAIRIRIFPDDIHVDSLDRGLSDDEQDAGRAYWNALWPADDPAVAAAAQLALIASVHADRAAWVATALTPNNLADAAPGVEPDFPKVAPRNRRAAVARLLPDRFVAVAIQGGVRSTATGLPVAPRLTVGLLSDDGTELAASPNGITAPVGTEWVYDYDRAVSEGMGITLRLSRAGAAVDQLVVFGVRASLDVDRSQAELEDLLMAHRHTRGLAIVPQGTPTNNTETDRAAWQRAIAVPPRGRAAAANPAAGTNAAAVASALGVDPAVLAELDHATEREQPQARAMNVALWSPSWGTMLDSVTTARDAKLTDAMREDIRTFFADSVRGRGPIPAMRVGNQPYGLLPVGNTDSRWRAHRADSLEGTLLDFLKRVRAMWRVSLANVPRIDGGGAGLDATVLEILGSSPVAQGLRVRTVLPSDFPTIVSDATGGAQDTQELERIIGQMILGEVILNASFTHPAGSLAKESRPLPLPFVHATDPAFIDALLTPNAALPKVASVLQALLALARSAADLAVQQAAPPSLVPTLVQSTNAFPPAVLETVLALNQNPDAVPTPTLHATANLVAAQVGEVGASVFAAHAPVAALRPSLGEMAVGSVSSGALQELVPLALTAYLRAQSRRAELRDALAELRSIGNDAAALDARRILLAETLDLASHRLDAWITGIVERRRASLRAARPRGVMVGAYGWVENLVRGGGAAANGGYIHAPSIAHAATAGMLRNAYLTHNPDASGSGAFAVDLSSTRVRVALDLLEGLRQGQSLGALLGYRIERELHEKRFDRLILSLRAIAPLVDGQLTTRNDEVPQPAAEVVAAANVVDGLKLVTMFQSSADKVFKPLAIGPSNNAFIPPGGWQPLSVDEKAGVQSAILGAIDAYDAYADLVLAEGVHQLVQGNTARAVAALDAGGSGEGPPIEPTVVQTPSQGVPFTHRLMIIVSGNAAPWNAERPRAKAEPRLEQWAATRLGAPADVVVHAAADGTLTLIDASGFAALDLVYESADRARLEQSLRSALPAIPAGDALATKRDPAWPPALRSIYEITELAASLREMLVRARIANPSDFTQASDKPTRVVSAAELNAVKARAVEARDGLATVLAALELAATPVGDVDPDDATIRAALEPLAAYGIAPPRATGAIATVLAQAAMSEAGKRLDAADIALAGAFDTQAASEVSQIIFGDGFWMIPALEPATPGDAFASALAGGAGTVAPANGAIRRFLRDVASVREAVGRTTESLLFGDALGRPTTLRVAQLAVPGTPGVDHWVGGPLDPAQGTPDRPVTNLIFEAPNDYSGATLDAALVIDQWIDVVPHRVKRGEGDDITIDERVVSGLAVNAPAASARAPQAILLAISPDGARWTSDALCDTLLDTMELARLRGVTLERTTGAARVLPALYEQSWSLQGEPVLDMRFVKENLVVSAMLQYVKES